MVIVKGAILLWLVIITKTHIAYSYCFSFWYDECIYIHIMWHKNCISINSCNFLTIIRCTITLHKNRSLLLHFKQQLVLYDLYIITIVIHMFNILFSVNWIKFLYIAIRKKSVTLDFPDSSQPEVVRKHLQQTP